MRHNTPVGSQRLAVLPPAATVPSRRGRPSCRLLRAAVQLDTQAGCLAACRALQDMQGLPNGMFYISMCHFIPEGWRTCAIVDQ